MATIRSLFRVHSKHDSWLSNLSQAPCVIVVYCLDATLFWDLYIRCSWPIDVVGFFLPLKYV